LIALVVALSSNRVIGRSGGLPWKLPTDLKHFRTLTTGSAVVMGRRTYESLPAGVRPLPDRRNLVLSSSRAYRAPGAEVFGNLTAALDACQNNCFVIGGGVTYSQALLHAGRVYATEIERECDGDTFFPELPADEWRCVEQSATIAESSERFRFVLYERRS
jgi:dihydrofolate reductase